MSRRNFLRKLGVGVAAIPLAKLASANTRPTRNSKPLIRLGVLLPDSARYPLLAENFINGLTLQLKANGNYQKHEIEIVVEKYQPDNSDLMKQVMRLSELHQIDVMTGIVSHYEMSRLIPVLEAREILFIENTIGEVIQPAPASPCVFRNSFHLWSSSFISGQWAVKAYGTRGLIAASFYDSGFNSHIAFEAGFVNAGGEVLQRIVTDLPNQDGMILQNAIKKEQPDFIFAQFSGIEGLGFVQQYNESKTKIPLIGSSLLCTTSNLNGLRRIASGIKSHGTWTTTLQNKENDAFVQQFLEQHTLPPDAFAVLGYETGSMLYTALKNCGQYPTTQDLIRSISEVTIDSPRGRLSMNRQMTSCPVYLKKVTSNNGNYMEVVAQQVELIDHNLPVVEALRTSIQSGWSNVYLS